MEMPLFFVEIGRLPPGLQNIEHGRRAMEKLVEQVQRCKSREGTGQMKMAPAKNPACISPLRPCGSRKRRRVEEFDFAGSADAAIEIFEIGAATERYVLAVVHVLAVGQHVGRCAATEEGTLFEQTYAANQIQPARRRLPVPASPPADHDHAFQGYSLPCGGPKRALAMNIIFSALVRRMRSPNTAKSSNSMRPK